ncbi:DNA-binding NarL/FixJ family response regulator [Bacteroides reticulotermitis]|uniref:DNA-binding NarL/FixJ family response regulator n=1 Tax=Bacteroides reticulotermitis TaxID=1133319 RepID=A0A840D3L4_9BACE|nr:response regulator transcription factor [Bacteroides reticulotermitis]MBB4043315.1 DNA-binding NarL/FixJ family response regulator [Bacteroides reticulotermitis]
MSEVKKDILLIDDHDLILQGIKFIIEQMPEAGFLATASAGGEACKWIDKKIFDLYILDIELPDTTGFELIDRIRERNPKARIIVNTMHDEVWNIHRLIQLEVDSAILKSSNIQEVQEAIHAVLNGETYFCTHFEAVRNKIQGIHAEAFTDELLTAREMEVLHAIAEGFSTNEIAERLHVSDNTIESHRKRLMVKLNARNAVDLVMRAISKGIINPKKNR